MLKTIKHNPQFRITTGHGIDYPMVRQPHVWELLETYY